MPVRILKIFIITSWLILLGLLIQRDFFISSLGSNEKAVLIRAKHEQYYGVYLNNKRIGYVMEDFRPLGDNNFQVRQKAKLRLKVLNSIQPITMDLTAKLDNTLHLNTFRFTFSSPFYTMQANGKAEGKTVYFTLDTGQTTIKDAITLQAPPLLPLNQRSYLLGRLTSPGDKLKVPFFDPLTLTARESVITYRGKEKLLLSNRVHNLHHFTDSYSGMQIHFWLNDHGKIIKEKSPAGFVFQAEPKFKAMDIDDAGDELLSSVAVHYTGSLLPESSTSARYRLELPDDIEMDLDGGRQRFINGHVLLTGETFPPSARSDHKTCDITDSLQPSRYVQSAHPDIIKQAKIIIGEETDPANQVILLANWVYQHLEKRPVLGLPDALTTLQSRRGDCNEHAALFTALARSLDIPTVIATGVTLYKNAFYYHAWNEVYLAGQWISLDTTTNQLPADLYHIRFGRGDFEEQLTVGALLGRLQIKILEQKQ